MIVFEFLWAAAGGGRTSKTYKVVWATALAFALLFMAVSAFFSIWGVAHLMGTL